MGLSKEKVEEVDMHQSVYDALRASGRNSHAYAIEGRVYAEDPSENFMPRPGLLQYVDLNSRQYDWLRVESYVRELFLRFYLSRRFTHLS
jgi:urea carboxylase